VPAPNNHPATQTKHNGMQFPQKLSEYGGYLELLLASNLPFGARAFLAKANKRRLKNDKCSDEQKIDPVLGLNMTFTSQMA
jgi:hypothetical protein